MFEGDISHFLNRLLSARLTKVDSHPKESQSETNCLEFASRCELVMLHGEPKGMRMPNAGEISTASNMSIVYGQRSLMAA
jgi:hypothetical protein